MNELEFWKRIDLLKGDRLLARVAEETGIPYQRLKNQRSNVQFPKITDAYILAEYLGTTVEYLLTGNGDPSIANEGYATRLLSNIQEKAPELYHTLVVTYGYAGAMADEIQQDKSTGA